MINIRDVVELETNDANNRQRFYAFILYSSPELIVCFDSSCQLRILRPSNTFEVTNRKIRWNGTTNIADYQNSRTREMVFRTVKNFTNTSFSRLVVTFIAMDFTFINNLIENVLPTDESRFRLSMEVYKYEFVENIGSKYTPVKGDIINGGDWDNDITIIGIVDDIEVNIEDSRVFYKVKVMQDGNEIIKRVRVTDVYEVIFKTGEMKEIKYKDGVFVQTKAIFPDEKTNRYYGIYVGKKSISKLVTETGNANVDVPILVRDKDKKRVINFNIGSTSIKSNFKAYMRLCSFKIKDSKASSDLFGFAKLKAKLIGKPIQIIELLNDFACKKDGKERDVALVRTETGREIKFLLEDLEVVYPNLDYKTRIDRKILKDKFVICTNPATPGIKKGKYYLVEHILKNKSNPNRNVLTLIDDDEKQIKSYQRNFKVNQECIIRTERLDLEVVKARRKKSQSEKEELTVDQRREELRNSILETQATIVDSGNNFSGWQTINVR